MRIISFITESKITRRILEHLDLREKKPSRDPPVRKSLSENCEIVYEPFDDGWPGYDEPCIVLRGRSIFF